MKPAWRGVVFEGEVWAWPMILMDHNQAFAVWGPLAQYDARWRQWEPGGKIDFDPGTTDEHKALVQAWVDAH